MPSSSFKEMERTFRRFKKKTQETSNTDLKFALFEHIR